MKDEIRVALAVGLLFVGEGLLTPPAACALARAWTSTGKPLYWDRTPVSLRVDAVPTIDALSGAQVLQALRASAARWSRSGNACTSFILRVDPQPGRNGDVAIDHVNRLVLRREAWCNPRKARCNDPAALAITTITSRISDGSIIDVDIELNATGGFWRDVVAQPVPGTEQHDLEAALTHEFGHLLGFDHSCLVPGEQSRVDENNHRVPLCSAEDPVAKASVMYPYESSLSEPSRVQSLQDVRDLCRVYPDFPDGIDGEGGFSCRTSPVAPGPSPVALALLAGVLAWLVRRNAGRAGQSNARKPGTATAGPGSSRR
jgi:hypothetical protein